MQIVCDSESGHEPFIPRTGFQALGIPSQDVR